MHLRFLTVVPGGNDGQVGDGTGGSGIHILMPAHAAGLTSGVAILSRLKSRDYMTPPRVSCSTRSQPALGRRTPWPGGDGVRRRALRLGACFTEGKGVTQPSRAVGDERTKLR